VFIRKRRPVLACLAPRSLFAGRQHRFGSKGRYFLFYLASFLAERKYGGSLLSKIIKNHVGQTPSKRPERKYRGLRSIWNLVRGSLIGSQKILLFPKRQIASPRSPTTWRPSRSFIGGHRALIAASRAQSSRAARATDFVPSVATACDADSSDALMLASAAADRRQ
jgi:hypothetical protein